MLTLSTTTRIDLRYVNPLAAAILGTPMYYAVTSVTPSTAAMCSDTYDARTCLDLGPLTLAPVVTSCVSGRIASPTGEGVVGPVRVLAGEMHVASRILPASCDGRFCLEVPWGQGPLTLESAMGTLAIDPPIQGIGGTCDRTMPMPAVACSAPTSAGQCDTGAGTFACNDSQVCSNPLHAIATDRGPAGCSNGERLLEVSSTGGGAPTFFHAHVLQGADRHEIDILTGTQRTLARCVAPGAYTIHLQANAGGAFPLTASASVIVGHSSGTLTVVAENGGRVTSTPAGIDCGATCSAPFATGETVTLHALDVLGSPVAVSWTGDCMGVDGTSSAWAATVVVNGDVRCRALFPVPRWYISIPPIGTQTPSSLFTVRPEAWDNATASYRPIVEVAPDVQRCDWQIARDGVVIAMPSTAACGPVLFGPASAMPDIVLAVGNYQLTVTAYLPDGTASEPASGGFGVL